MRRDRGDPAHPKRSRRLIAALVAVSLALAAPSVLHRTFADVLPITGTFYADDNGVYYMQQDGSDVWWMGESVDKDPNPQGGLLGPNHVWNRGLVSTSVFHGTITGSTLTGPWVEVSRGSSLHAGTMSLAINSATDNNGVTHAILSLSGGSSPDGASLWQQGDPVSDWFFQYPATGNTQLLDFYNRFQNAKKSVPPSNNSQGDKLGDTNNPEELRPYRDQTVFTGELEALGVNEENNVTNSEFPHVNFPPADHPLALRTYHDFGCYANDGDLDLRMRIYDSGIPTDFTNTIGWGNSNAADEGESGNDSQDVLPKLHSVGPFTTGFHLGVEGIMYGGDNVDGCPVDAARVLPGWADSNGNSILVNGRPINGRTQPGNLMVAANPSRPVNSGQTALAGLNGNALVAADPPKGVPYGYGTEIRVTGALILDCGHSDLDDDEAYVTPTDHVHSCEQTETYEEIDNQNQEIHTFYSLDLVECPLGHYPSCPPGHRTVRQNLTGAWGSDDGGTYYVRQIGNDIWWAGLTRNRDPIMPDDPSRVADPMANPTNVFHGTVTHNPDGSATITGTAITIPRGFARGDQVDTATFTVDPDRKQMDLASTSTHDFPWPSHFEKLYEPPDTVPPCSSLSIGPPRYLATGVTYVTSATVLRLHPCTSDDANQIQNVWYRVYRAGSTPPAFTPLQGTTAALHVSGPDGKYVVDTFATDDSGNDETAHSLMVHLDNGGPTTTITRPAAVSYVHSATLTLQFGVTDGTGSGVASTVPTLDGARQLPGGQPLGNGVQVSLLTQVGLGSHTFTVTSRDNLGNGGTRSVAFSIIVTPASIQDDVRQFAASGAINDQNVADGWITMLKAAANARAGGDCTTASQDYGSFIKNVRAQSGQAVVASAAGILVKDAQYLVAHCP